MEECTVASIHEYLDRQVIVVLRDGRKYAGILRSFDQFANFVLEETRERVAIPDARVYGEVPLIPHTMYIRGENVVLLGRLDEGKDQHQMDNCTHTAEEMQTLVRQNEEDLQRKREVRRAWMLSNGLHDDAGDEDVM